MDWGKPKTIFSAAGFKILQWVGGHKTTDDLKQGLFKVLVQNQGFTITEKNTSIRALERFTFMMQCLILREIYLHLIVEQGIILLITVF